MDVNPDQNRPQHSEKEVQQSCFSLINQICFPIKLNLDHAWPIIEREFAFLFIHKYFMDQDKRVNIGMIANAWDKNRGR